MADQNEATLIKSEEQKREWFTMLPNGLNYIDLTVYEFRLMAFFRQFTTCRMSTKKIEQYTRMSYSMVARTRQSLADRGLIKLRRIERSGPDDYYYEVTIVDFWGRNSGIKDRMCGSSEGSTPSTEYQGAPADPSYDVLAPLVPHGTDKDSKDQYQTNTSVAPPRDASGLVGEKPERQKSQRDLVIGELEDHFCQLTGIPKPHRKTEGDRKKAGRRWWSPLWHFWTETEDTAFTKDVMGRAVSRMRSKRMTIAAPESIEKTWYAIFGEIYGPRARED